jgi:hypothetical protein
MPPTNNFHPQPQIDRQAGDFIIQLSFFESRLKKGNPESPFCILQSGRGPIYLYGRAEKA